MPTLPFSGIRSRLCDQKKWKFFFFWYGQSTEYFIYSTLYIERENNTTGLTIFPAIFLYLFFCIFFFDDSINILLKMNKSFTTY